MSLINGLCPNCNRSIIVDSSLRAAICPHCNQAYVVADVCGTIPQVQNNAYYYFNKAKSYLKIGEEKKAREFLIEALSESPEDNAIKFFYKMTNSGFIMDAEKKQYLQEHPAIEPYEKEYLSIAKYHFTYFCSFFPWYGGDIFDQQRCDLYCRMFTLTLPGGRYSSNCFTYTQNNRWIWRPLWQIEYLLKHDINKTLRPYEKFELVTYDRDFGPNRVMSTYDILVGKSSTSGCACAPSLMKNTDIARLIERYYPY